MLSLENAQAYLTDALGVSLPDFLVRAARARVEAVEPAMLAAGYSEPLMVQIQAMAIAVIASAGAPRRLQSQGAPSGASRSFKNADNALSQLRRSLAALDTARTVAALVGPDPAAATLLLVAY